MAGHQQMTAREKDIYDTYSEDLEGLTFNSKPIINSMTELANEYSSDFAHVIVRCIEDKIKMVQSSHKLPLLYLLDSVLKNHTRPYHDLFQQNIVSIFAHVFHNVPREHAEKVRTALYKLRTTWTDTYFSLTKLNQLDRKIQTLDPQWPIIPSKKAIPVEKNYKPPSQSIHINPAVFGRQQSLTPENDLDAQMKQKELELMELKMKREELALENMRQQLAAGREAKITDDRQQPAVIHQSQSTSLQVCNSLNPFVLYLTILARNENLQLSNRRISIIKENVYKMDTDLFCLSTANSYRNIKNEHFRKNIVRCPG